MPGNPANGFESPALEMAAKTWSGEWWRLGGGGTVWDSMAYDPELDLLYVGVGNGSPWNHLIRSEGKGDNLFLASIVALDPDEGSYVWHYQTSPGETWDHTATQHIIVADLRLSGAVRRVVMQAPKNGFFYVLDAKTGELISAKNFTDISWATHVDLKTGRPVETPDARFYKTGRPFLSLQNPNGAHTWHPMSFNPDTGLVYIPVHYGTYCGRCHGPEGAANFGILPDLRYSAALHSSEAWAAVVLKGAMQANGMASFAPVLDAGEAEAIRAYVIAQAHASQQRSN